jgi:carbamoyltransferase
LLTAFYEESNCPVLVNTSFNVRGEPIVCTPEDAYRCFMRTEIDYLVIENCLLSKSDQPVWEETDNWREEFELD